MFSAGVLRKSYLPLKLSKFQAIISVCMSMVFLKQVGLFFSFTHVPNAKN